MKYDVVLYSPNGFKTERLLQLPMGLMAISSCLKKAGFTVRIVHEYTIQDNIKTVLNCITKDTLFFGISSCSGTTIYDGLLVSQKVKEKYPDLPIVWGGSHVSGLPEQSVKHPLVDVVVTGQAEITIVRLAKDLKKGKSVDRIIKGESIDINNFPMLDYEGIDIVKYITEIPKEKLTYDNISTRVIGYSSSRGCVHRCGFCAISALCGRKWTGYTAERTVKEIEWLVRKYKVNGIIFADDNFFIDKDRVEKICDLLIEKNIDLKWGAMCRCDYFARYSDEFIAKLKKSGCESLFFGAESGSQRMLDYMTKDIKVEDILICARKSRKHKIKAKFFFMMGFPTETIEDLHKTIDVLNEIYKIIPETLHPVLIYTPYAKTRLMKESIKHGLKPPQSLEEWGTYHFLSYNKPWGTKEFKHLVEMVNIICQFLLGYQTGDRFKKLWQRIAFKILQKDAKFRWEHKFFKFAPEWKLVKKYYDKQLENCKRQWLKEVKI